MDSATFLRPDPNAGLSLAEIGFDRGPSAAAFAYASLRQAILSLALPPGTQLSRAAIAAGLGVSQTPVREALIRLQEEDLVEVVPQSATRVARIDLDSVRTAHFLRLAVEVEAVRHLAAAPPPGLVGRLEGQIAAQREMLSRDDQAAFTRSDGAFHALLLEAAGVGSLAELIRTRSGHLDRLRRLDLPAPGKREAILRDHARIAGALAAADPMAAETALREHLGGTLARVADIRDAMPGHFRDGG